MTPDIVTEARDLTDAANKADRPHAYPHSVTDGDVLVWKCHRCDEWVREAGRRSSCTAAPPPDKVFVPVRLVTELVAEVERLRTALDQRPPGDLLVTLNPDGVAARLLGGDQ